MCKLPGFHNLGNRALFHRATSGCTPKGNLAIATVTIWLLVDAVHGFVAEVQLAKDVINIREIRSAIVPHPQKSRWVTHVVTMMRLVDQEGLQWYSSHVNGRRTKGIHFTEWNAVVRILIKIPEKNR